MFGAPPLLIIKKSKGGPAATVHPMEEEVVYTVENSVKKTVCGFRFESLIILEAAGRVLAPTPRAHRRRKPLKGGGGQSTQLHY